MNRWISSSSCRALLRRSCSVNVNGRAAPLSTTGTATTTNNAFQQSKQRTPPLPILSPPEELPALNKGLLVELYDRISPKADHERKRLAEEFYQAISRQASHPTWFGAGRIPNNFRNRHALLAMHLWFVHKRLVSDTADPFRALKIQEGLFAILWEETTSRIRHEGGVPEMMIYKSLGKVQQYTWIHLTHYDHVYTQLLDKPAERLRELRNLIARHVLIEPSDAQVFQQQEEQHIQKQKQQQQQVAPNSSSSSDATTTTGAPFPPGQDFTKGKLASQLDRLAWYVDAQYQNIVLDWPHVDYREARVAWVSPPSFEGLVDNQGRPLLMTGAAEKTTGDHHDKENVVDDKRNNSPALLPSPWLTNLTLKGEEYYWNPETSETSWEKPLPSS